MKRKYRSLIDQKRGLIELKPGYHVVIRVVPKVVETSEDFEAFNVKKRKCKLPNENDGLKFLKNYTKVGISCCLQFMEILSLCNV